MIDLDKLEALARAATPGPWEVQVDERPHHRGGAHIERRIRTSWEHGQLKAPYPVITTSVGVGAAAGGPAHYMVSLGEHDAAHIAAANPAAVLELIALARQADTIHIPVLTDAELIARFPLPGTPVQRINLSHGAYVERETKTTGEPGWLLCAPDGTAVRGLNAYEAEFIDSALRAASAPAQPVQQAAPVAVPHYESGRKQGRAEALAILMQLDPEGGIDEYTGWSTPVGPEDEGAAYWEEEKLRDLFAADGALADMMDRAEAEYWKYLGMQDEAERAKNFADNMHNSGKVREVLSKAGEFDLMGRLCSTAPVAAPVAGQAIDLIVRDIAELDYSSDISPDLMQVTEADLQLIIARHAAPVPAASVQPAAFPDRDHSQPAERQGVFHKFDVRRVDHSDAPGGKHHGCRYFVLDMDHDQHAGPALAAYAGSCVVTHPSVSAELVAEFGQQDGARDAAMAKVKALAWKWHRESVEQGFACSEPAQELFDVLGWPADPGGHHAAEKGGA